MQKKFLTSLFILLGVNLIVKPVWILGIDRSVQNLAGPAEYGFYFAMLNFSFLFNILLDLGITNFNNRNISQNHQLLNKHFSGISMLKLMLAGLYLIATFATGYFIGYDSRQFHFLIFLTINQFLLSFILYLRSNISGLQLFKTDSLLSVLDRLLMIIFCSALIWGNFTTAPFKIEWFLYAQTAAYLCSFLICLVIVAVKAKFRKPRWNFLFFRLIIKQSFPFALLILLMTFYNRVDSVMLERMLDNGNRFAGIYAAAYRLLDAFSMIAYLFAVILLPLFSRMLKIKENILPIIRISFSMLFVFSTYIALFCAFNSQQLMSIMYHDLQAESAKVFTILIFCFIPVSATYIFGTLLTANGSLKKLNIIAFSGMLLNIGLNLFIIPKFLATGAASVSLATQSITAILQMIYVVILFKIKPDYGYIFKLLLHMCILIAALIVIKNHTDNLLIIFSGSAAIAFSTAITLKILQPLRFLKIMTEKKPEGK
jgi:O-antigen/teichoic acid export membrane protein